MTTNTQAAPTGSALRWNRIASIAAWLFGVLFTYLLLIAVAPDVSRLVLLTLAAVAQFLLTLAERPLWRWALRRKGGKLVAFGLLVTLFDAAINAGGIYPYVPRLASSDLGLMLIEVFHLEPNVSQPAAAVIAMALGLLVAGLSEYLWEVE